MLRRDISMYLATKIWARAGSVKGTRIELTTTIPKTREMLASTLVIFCPLILAEILKPFVPNFTAKLCKGQFSISLASFVITNLGVFSRYAAFLREEPSTVLISLGVSVILAVFYFAAGMLFSLGRPLPDHLSSIITLGFINNVLVLVLSSEFSVPSKQLWQRCIQSLSLA